MQPALHRTFDFLIQHGLAVLFGWVLVEQLGVPVPAMPLLLRIRYVGACTNLTRVATVSVPIVADLRTQWSWVFAISPACSW